MGDSVRCVGIQFVDVPTPSESGAEDTRTPDAPRLPNCFQTSRSVWTARVFTAAFPIRVSDSHRVLDP